MRREPVTSLERLLGRTIPLAEVESRDSHSPMYLELADIKAIAGEMVGV
jgi:hypothetical protein